ncbi:hypothetical protein QTI24_19275 [Variovorax sp. J22P240]|uniref:hypothetical protein n=1 Tax=unclassified Variovorax TaxID=663243 RepID=UPI002575AC59|nr:MULTISPECIES: hypothetical protein [unclassified Variovorax]MDM0000764.1 hypothetical protein [Variovorax sp. J22P240]MDM0049809.1 hypothetical protein [Variovorax sp. J22R115]
MTIREPLSVTRLRKSPSADAKILLAYIDALVDEVERLEIPLTLSREAIFEAVGMPTDTIGGEPAWVLGGRDLVRLAHAILEAAMKERA